MLMIGIWPIIMGITMWLQMRLNPTPPDPVQASLFNWMPVIFTFMLGTFRRDSSFTGHGATRSRSCSSR